MPETKVAHPAIATAQEWRRQRLELLHQEKELTRQRDRVNAARRRLPMTRLEKDYRFEGEEGPLSLLELFRGQKQLVVYHFMFHPDWTDGCQGCTGFVDALGDLSMLEKRDTTLVLVSRAPLAKLLAYRAKRGWRRPWVSSGGSDFNYDFHVSFPAGQPVEYNYHTLPEKEGHSLPEGHGLSVFFQLDGHVYHTYSCFARGCEGVTDAYGLLDLTPYGRQEDFEESPEGWPQQPTYGKRDE